MRKIFFWIILAVFWASVAQAEIWLVRSLDATGGIRENRWEILRTEAGIEYFLQGQDKPVYTLASIPSESQLVLVNGMVRRFSAGFLLLTDLPMPVFVPVEEAFKNGRHCFQEYVGGMGFQNCVSMVWKESLDEARSLPAPQPGEAVLVCQDKRVAAIIGPDFQAERVE